MQSKIKDKMQAMIASQMRIVAKRESQQQTQKAQTTIKKNNNDFREEKKKDAEVQKDTPEFAQQEHETALDIHKKALQAKIAAEKVYNQAHDNYKATFKEQIAIQQEYLAIEKAFQKITVQLDAATEYRSNMQNAFNEASKNELDASNKAMETNYHIKQTYKAMETAYNKKQTDNQASKKAAKDEFSQLQKEANANQAIQKKNKSSGKDIFEKLFTEGTPLEHCEKVYEHLQGQIEGDKSESYHRAQLMEAADKLKGINLDSVIIKKEGGYTGGFKDGKKHGFCLYYYYERGFAGNSSYCDYSSTWQAYNNGTCIWSHQFDSGGW